MDFDELMRCAPSTRRFTDEPVSDELLYGVLDRARFAPSGGNRQGWGVVIVREQQRRTRLRELYVPHWEAYIEATGAAAVLRQGGGDGISEGRLRGLRAADEYARSFDRVPVHLVICVSADALAITDAALDRPSIVGGASVYPFVQNILLGLRAAELGASFTTLLVPAEAEVRTLLELPDGVLLAGHIAVGRRADPWPRRLTRRPVEEFAFAERYGTPWLST
ncbi:MAG: nitroreductase family protein [Solirubrobacteraceae bacterium]